MAISKKIQLKYPDYIKMMKDLRFDDYEIESRLQEMEDLKGWKSISLRELRLMSQPELDELKSYCWHDGRHRCDCIGITDLKISGPSKGGHFLIEFSDADGIQDLKSIMKILQLIILVMVNGTTDFLKKLKIIWKIENLIVSL